MKKVAWLALIFLVSIGIFTWAVEEGKPEVAQAKGESVAYQDITPCQAYEMLMTDPERTFLIDCRTRPEYKFVGHPEMAYNIPYKFWTPEGMVENPNFIRDVEARFKKTDRLILICRSGKRSRLACEVLIEAEFEHVFNVLGGFEGDKVEDKNSIYYGYRRHINGWQHDGLPYTYEIYEINEESVYKPTLSCGCE